MTAPAATSGLDATGEKPTKATVLRFQALDSWRGVCALLVALFHLPVVNHLSGTAFLTGSYLFVDFFFVLSGFVIAHAYGNRLEGKQAFAGFVIRRFGRLWPLHAAILCMFVLLKLANLLTATDLAAAWQDAFSGAYDLRFVASNLALVHALHIDGMLSWNTPSWSISTEFWTCLCFGLVAWHLRERARLLAAFVLVLLGLGITGVLVADRRNMDITYDWGLFRCMYGFFVGTLVIQVRKILRPELRLASYAEAICVLLVIGFITLAGGVAPHLGLFGPPLFALVVLVFSYEAGVFTAILRQPWLRKLGLWSYSIYMTHILLFSAFNRLLQTIEPLLDQPLISSNQLPDGTKMIRFDVNNLWVADLVAIAVILCLVGLSAFTFQMIEEPARNWFHKLARKIEKRV